MMCDSDDDTYHRFAEASDSLSDISSVSDEEVFKLFNAADSEEENSEVDVPHSFLEEMNQSGDNTQDQLSMDCQENFVNDSEDLSEEDAYYAEYAALEPEFTELTNQSSKRKPTFIETSESEWDEYRDILNILYDIGWNGVHHFADLGERASERKMICLQCKSEDVDDVKYPVYVVMQGIRNVQKIVCNKCSFEEKPVHLMVLGLFPLSVKKFIFITFETMDLLSTLGNFNPLLSNTSIVNSLNFISLKNQQDYTIRPEVMNAIIKEWKRLEFGGFKQEFSLFECPACADEPHAIHIDGNAKLYRYEKAGSVTESSYRSPLILDDDTVHNEVQSLRAKKVITRNTCGDTTLRAAKSGGRRHQFKDETGIMLATCRHMFVLKALDMRQGEIFEYPYILQKQFPTARYIAHDTICKYWPWLQKLDGIVADSQSPILSVMHAKSHSWNCQVKWSAKVVSGAGKSTGETTELVNSYLSRLGPVTRNACKTWRKEKITYSSGFWNIRKLMELPPLLAKSLKKRTNQLAELEESLEVVRSEINRDLDYLDALATKLASIGQGATTHNEKTIEELCCRYQRLVTKVLTEADSSKSRAVLRGSLSKLNDQLQVEFEKYLKLKKRRGVTKKTLEECKKTLVFPWSHQGLSPEDLNPTNLAAVEIMQSRDRAKEEIQILRREVKRLVTRVAYLSAETICEERSWLLCYMIDVTAVLPTPAIQPDEGYFYVEPSLESDTEGDS